MIETHQNNFRYNENQVPNSRNMGDAVKPEIGVCLGALKSFPSSFLTYISAAGDVTGVQQRKMERAVNCQYKYSSSTGTQERCDVVMSDDE
jgi:hypothetical protein